MVDYAATAADFRAGRVLARTFSTLFRNILPFGLLALVLTSPTFIYMILTLSGHGLEQGAQSPLEGIVLFVVDFLLGYLVTAALVYGTIQDLRHEKVSIGECFSNGLSMMFPVVGVAIVSGLLTGLAALALIIPGIIVAIMLWVAIPVAVIERRGLESLPRSSDLTRGYRWRIFFLLLLLLVIFFGIGLIVGAVSAAISMTDMNSGPGFSPSAVTGLLTTQWVFSAFLSALTAVLAAVSYHDLRVAKEGADTEQIAAVFD